MLHVGGKDEVVVTVIEKLIQEKNSTCLNHNIHDIEDGRKC